MPLKILTAILMMVLAGCATGRSDPFTPETMNASADAILYIYRPPAALAWNSAAAFEVDRKFVGKVKPGGHLKIRVKPGTHAVGWREQAFGIPLYRKSIKVPAQTGGSYYIRADWLLDAIAYGGTPIFSMHLTLIPDQQALADLQQKNR